MDFAKIWSRLVFPLAKGCFVQQACLVDIAWASDPGATFPLVATVDVISFPSATAVLGACCCACFLSRWAPSAGEIKMRHGT